MEFQNLISDLNAGFKNQIAVTIAHGDTGIWRFLDDFNEQVVEETFMPIDFCQFDHIGSICQRADESVGFRAF
ncbi:MAG: hypothetical protein Q7U64_14270 [Desulfocapsaceae bacterium]|nr:hypothetical protein [Desulfocapsaceae bacterium]